MRKQIVTVALVGGLGLGGAALLAPGWATADTAGGAGAVTDQVSRIKNALAGLVSDNTITQAQADKVAQTLAEQLPARGPGGPGHGPRAAHLTPEATAAVLGISVDELHAAREAGKTLAQIAADEGISKADLVSGLVAAAEKQLAADVAAGRLTQAQSDEISAGLEARITEKVDKVGGPHRGHGVRSHHGGRGPGAPAPSGSGTPAPSASSSSV